MKFKFYYNNLESLKLKFLFENCSYNYYFFILIKVENMDLTVSLKK
jgi:hypothetical protein